MLKNRIISTLTFFDLQDYPLTLLELQRFLIAEVEVLKTQIDGQGEVVGSSAGQAGEVPIDQILKSLGTECPDQIKNTLGFYHLAGREGLVSARLQNYSFGINREKLIRRFAKGLRFIPFVRGAALAGSQAIGQQKESSDIDLLIITDTKFMWLARTLVTIYFQILGLRRHGGKITNRFCLNHYLAGPKEINHLKNLYTACEYLKLRPLVYAAGIANFQKNNLQWIKVFFPNSQSPSSTFEKQNGTQLILENIFKNKFGVALEKLLKNWQLPKIRQEKFIVVEEDELSFHPDSKQQVLLQKFFYD